MATGPLFSVVIATYGRADFVTKTIDSVLRQTEESFEIVIIDDGSVDHTREALGPYEGRIRYFYQENQGMARARNRGIREARGEFVALLDSDDLWEARYLEEVRKVFEQYPETGAVFVAERDIDAQGVRRSRVYGKRSEGRWFTPISMISTDTRVGSGRLPVVRRALLTEFGAYDVGLCGAWDSELWIRLSFQVPMTVVPEPLVLRRRHKGNYSSDKVKDGKAWLVILDRVARDRPEFARDHAWALRRARSKSFLRVGRSLLARSAEEPDQLPEARHYLRRALLLYPLFLRAWSYLAIGLAAPSSYQRLHDLGVRIVDRMNLGPRRTLRTPPAEPDHHWSRGT